MIVYKIGDLFSSDCQTLVNTVNCEGFMGKGIALEFKNRYPVMFKSYKTICKNKLLRPGLLQLWKSKEHWVLNFPTKDKWKNKSETSFIEAGLLKFVDVYKEKEITSIAFPLLGCSNGGLDFERDVKPLMEDYLGHLDILIEIWERD
jgi:O-acetyl-ADP-ribose deacetylase (regulator of RNase III)